MGALQRPLLMTNGETRNASQMPFDGIDHETLASIGDAEPDPNSIVCGDARVVEMPA